MKNNTDAEIRAIALDVYRSLGSGYSESVYDHAMQVGLRLKKIKYESQKIVELKYKEHYVGYGCPDFTRVQISCLTTFPTLKTLGITQL